MGKSTASVGQETEEGPQWSSRGMVCVLVTLEREPTTDELEALAEKIVTRVKACEGVIDADLFNADFHRHAGNGYSE